MDRKLAPVVLGLLIVSGAQTVSAVASLDSALRELHLADERYFADGSTETLREFGRELESIYRRSLRPIALSGKALDDKSLSALFDGMQTVAFYSESAAVVKDMERLFAELEHRKLATQDLVKDFNDVCLLTHAEESCGLASKFPGLPVIPPTRRSVGLSKAGRVLDFDDDASATIVRSLAWHKGAKIILLTSPGCNPGKLAVSNIESDPALRAVFEAHAFLLAPSQSVNEAKDIMAWNREHTSLRNFVAYSLADWPMFDHWRTPTFLFLKDGTTLYRFGGWTHPDERGEYRSKLLHGLELIGLAPKQ